MINEVLTGKRTQFRVPINPQPQCDIPDAYFDAYNGGPQWNWWTKDNRVCNGHEIYTCPYVVGKHIVTPDFMLEIEYGGAQRIQDITIEDILAEGLPPLGCDEDASELYEAYAEFFDRLHGEGRWWDDNYLVWVCKFKLLYSGIH